MIILLILLILSCIILIHECGHFFAAKYFNVKVEEFGFGFPPRIFGKKKGETVYSFNLLPFGGFVKIFGEDRKEDGDMSQENDMKRSFALQSLGHRAIILLGGIIMNVIFGWVLLSVVLMIGSPRHLMITHVAQNSPAEVQGIKEGDIVIEVKRNDVSMYDPIEVEDFVRVVRSDAGTPFVITFQRGKEVFSRTIEARSNPPQGEGVLGVGIQDIGFAAEPFFQSIYHGAIRSIEMMWLIAKGLISFFATVFINPNTLQSVAGPVGIFMMAQHAGELGIVYLVQLIGMISLNLAVLNLIPFPALDGGRVLFLIIEKIKGSPLSLRGERIANITGFVILLLLMGAVTIGDILKII